MRHHAKTLFPELAGIEMDNFPKNQPLQQCMAPSWGYQSYGLQVGTSMQKSGSTVLKFGMHIPEVLQSLTEQDLIDFLDPENLEYKMDSAFLNQRHERRIGCLE